MIGFAPGQMAPMHDHPLEGLLYNIIRGPGLFETFFWKESLNMTRPFIGLDDNGRPNKTGIYQLLIKKLSNIPSLSRH